MCGRSHRGCTDRTNAANAANAAVTIRLDHQGETDNAVGDNLIDSVGIFRKVRKNRNKIYLFYYFFFYLKFYYLNSTQIREVSAKNCRKNGGVCVWHKIPDCNDTNMTTNKFSITEKVMCMPVKMFPLLHHMKNKLSFSEGTMLTSGGGYPPLHIYSH